MTFPMIHTTSSTSMICEVLQRWLYCRISLSEAAHSAMREVLQIPALLKCDQRSAITGTKGLFMLLKRLAYPCRYSDFVYRFGRPLPVLCLITNKVHNDTHRRKINNWNNGILNRAALQMYADAISANGAALDNCFGFIEGTVKPFYKPGKW